MRLLHFLGCEFRFIRADTADFVRVRTFGRGHRLRHSRQVNGSFRASANVRGRRLVPDSGYRRSRKMSTASQTPGKSLVGGRLRPLGRLRPVPTARPTCAKLHRARLTLYVTTSARPVCRRTSNKLMHAYRSVRHALDRPSTPPVERPHATVRSRDNVPALAAAAPAQNAAPPHFHQFTGVVSVLQQIRGGRATRPVTSPLSRSRPWRWCTSWRPSVILCVGSLGGGQLGFGLRHGWFLLLVFDGFLAGLG